jgi:DNA-binding transcriptional ArsR family regulator
MKSLAQAGLVESRHQSRFIYYSANFESMSALLGYLGENCCEGGSSVPDAGPPRRRR